MSLSVHTHFQPPVNVSCKYKKDMLCLCMLQLNHTEQCVQRYDIFHRLLLKKHNLNKSYKMTFHIKILQYWVMGAYIIATSLLSCYYCCCCHCYKWYESFIRTSWFILQKRAEMLVPFLKNSLRFTPTGDNIRTKWWRHGHRTSVGVLCSPGSGLSSPTS